MTCISLHDQAEIQNYLLGNPLLNLYALGDLDPFFWPATTWYAWQNGTETEALVLLYRGNLSQPTLLALSEQIEPLQKLLAALLPVLPVRFYAHLSPGLEAILAPQYLSQPHGLHYRMGLKELQDFPQTHRVSWLGEKDLAAITQLYAAAYPDNWFDARMLATGKYAGVYKDSELVSIAGIHVYSPEYKVAALGNITTHPKFRGQKLALQTTGVLCQDLLKTTRFIGLNVHHQNQAALRCYQQLGFEIVAEFNEAEWVLNPSVLDRH